MTRRERLLAALAGQQVDHLPTQITFTPLAAEQAASWLGMRPADLPLAPGNHWGASLAFWGGICTQRVLPFGSPAEVQQHIDHCRRTLGRYGRYVIGPSHGLTSDVPRANFFAMLEAMEVEPTR